MFLQILSTIEEKKLKNNHILENNSKDNSLYKIPLINCYPSIEQIQCIIFYPMLCIIGTCTILCCSPHIIYHNIRNCNK
jgi:hypothetical protein